MQLKQTGRERQKMHDAPMVMLDNILNLKPGWYDGEGTAFDKNDIEWLRQSFKKYYLWYLPDPVIYPTVDGQVQIEWIISQRDITLTVNLITKKGFYHSFDCEDNRVYCENIDLAVQQGWARLTACLINENT